jgi:hypothetical protein
MNRSTEERLVEAEAACQTLTIKFARASRMNDLQKLQLEQNIDLDIADELSFVAPEDSLPMPENLYKAHLQRIVKKYQRTPVNTDLIITRNGPSMTTKAKVDAAVEMATSKGIPFPEALKLVSE